jgi:hypothetical protein
MTNNHKRLVRLLARFDHAVGQARENAELTYDMDSRFDGGEFSGPSIARALAREEDRIARRFGFASADLAWDVYNQFMRPTSYHSVFGGPVPLPR